MIEAWGIVGRSGELFTYVTFGSQAEARDWSSRHWTLPGMKETGLRPVPVTVSIKDDPEQP